MSRENPEFFGSARAEGLRYGDDPWVFLRELGQNARDAGARSIDIGTWVRDGFERLVFSDDGSGMTLEHARRYLFRLYASSKDDDPRSAGQYGVGFWSVLRFDPELIEVHSLCGREAWAVELSGDLDRSRRIDCIRRRRGTSVVLKRRAGDGLSFEGRVAEAVSQYLAHLRTAGRRARPLPVSLNGESVNKPFWLEGPGALAFRDGPVEGVVGFGERPSYVLYARGLPVKKGDYIDELEGRIRKRRPHDEREGASPVFLLCGNNLDVDLTRMTVVRDQRLDDLLRTARRRFDELIRRTIDKAVGRSPAGRLWNRITTLWRSLGSIPRRIRLAVSLLGLLCLGWLLGLLFLAARPRLSENPLPANLTLSRGSSGSPGTPGARKILQPVFEPQTLERLQVGTVSAPVKEPGWALEYRPPGPLLFRIAAFENFDSYKGWLPAGGGSGWHTPSATRDGPDTITIYLALESKPGDWLVPVPTGYRGLAGSGRIGRRKVTLEASREGSLRAKIPDGLPAGQLLKLEYRVVPGGLPPEGFGTGGDQRPDWPAAVSGRLREISHLPQRQRIEAARKLVQGLLVYDRSSQTARAYSNAGQGEWVRRVLSIGYGDCDVVNGLLALALREVGVPARLAVGLVGRGGQVLPGTHAWVEIGGKKLDALDATVGMPERDGRVEPAAPEFPVQLVARRSQSLGQVTVVSLGVIIALLAVLVLLYVRSSTRRLRITENSAGQHKLLANLAIDAVRRPQAWRDIRGLWQRRFIPCLGGKRLSLAQIARLGKSGRLLVGRRENQLAEQAMGGGARILDQSDVAFGDLYPLLPNVRYLDEIERYRPIAYGSGPGRELLEALDALFKKARAGVSCQATDALSDRLYRDVDISPIRPRSASGWSRRFLAINLEHPLWRAIAGLYCTRPALAVCMAADRLAQDSWLLIDQAPRLRRLAARRALAEAGR